MSHHVLEILTPLLGQQPSQYSLSVLVSFVPFVVLVVLIGMALYWAKRSVRRRTAGFQQRAATLGLCYVEQSDRPQLDHLAEFQLFSQGRNGQVTNVMQGESQVAEVSVFDYAYVTGSGKRAQTHRQSVICFQASLCSWPAFALRPTGLFHRFVEGAGYRPIDRAVAPLLPESYLLCGDDEAAVAALFGEDQWRVIGSQSTVSLEARGNRFLFYRQRQRVNPEQLEQFLAEGLELFTLLASPDA